MAMATALFGPWLALFMHPAVVVLVIVSSSAAGPAAWWGSDHHPCPQHQEWGRLRHQVHTLAGAICTYTTETDFGCRHCY
jgi:hypothetical protein